MWKWRMRRKFRWFWIVCCDTRWGFWFIGSINDLNIIVCFYLIGYRYGYFVLWIVSTRFFGVFWFIRVYYFYIIFYDFNDFWLGVFCWGVFYEFFFRNFILWVICFEIIERVWGIFILNFLTFNFWIWGLYFRGFFVFFMNFEKIWCFDMFEFCIVVEIVFIFIIRM